MFMDGVYPFTTYAWMEFIITQHMHEWILSIYNIFVDEVYHYTTFIHSQIYVDGVYPFTTYTRMEFITKQHMHGWIFFIQKYMHGMRESIHNICMDGVYPYITYAWIEFTHMRKMIIFLICLKSLSRPTCVKLIFFLLVTECGAHV